LGTYDAFKSQLEEHKNEESEAQAEMSQREQLPPAQKNENVEMANSMMNYPNVIENESDMSQIVDDNLDPDVRKTPIDKSSLEKAGAIPRRFKDSNPPLMGTKRNNSKNRL